MISIRYVIRPVVTTRRRGLLGLATLVGVTLAFAIVPPRAYSQSGPPEPDVLRAEVRAELLDSAWAAVRAARWAEADKRLATLDTQMRKALPARHVALVPMLRARGELASTLYEFRDADRYFNEARNILANTKVDEREVAAVLHAWADSLVLQERWWEATQARNRELSFLERTQGSESFAVGVALLDLAQLLTTPYPYRFSLRQSTLDRASRILTASYRGAEPDAPSSIEAMVRWVRTRGPSPAAGEWDECTLRRQLVEASERQFGATAVQLVRPLTDYAARCELQMKGPEVEALYERALTIAKSTWGELHPDVFYVLEHKGEYLVSRKGSTPWVKSANAQGNLILKALATQKARHYSAQGALLAVERIRSAMAEGSADCERFDAPTCSAALRTALVTLERHWEANHPALAELRVRLAQSLGMRKPDAREPNASVAERRRFAERQFKLAAEVALARNGPAHPQTARLSRAFAGYLDYLGRYSEAAELQKTVIASYQKHFGREDAAVAQEIKLLERFSGRALGGSALSGRP